MPLAGVECMYRRNDGYNCFGGTTHLRASLLEQHTMKKAINILWSLILKIALKKVLE